jgi:hypothetical protein
VRRRYRPSPRSATVSDSGIVATPTRPARVDQQQLALEIGSVAAAVQRLRRFVAADRWRAAVLLIVLGGAITGVVLFVSGGPEFEITESELATSLENEYTPRLRKLENALNASLAQSGQPSVSLGFSPADTTCRSRENTPAKTGVPFVCIVILSSDTGTEFTMGFLIPEVDGRCWKAYVDRVNFNDGSGVHRADPSVQQASRLAGCA